MSHIHSELRRFAWVSHSSEMKGSEYPPFSTWPTEGYIQQPTGNSIQLVLATHFYSLGKTRESWVKGLSCRFPELAVVQQATLLEPGRLPVSLMPPHDISFSSHITHEEYFIYKLGSIFSKFH